MRGNVPANPRGYGNKCGGFLPVLRLSTLQASVPQGVVVGMCRGVVGGGGTVVHAVSCQSLLVGGRVCRTGIFRSFMVFSVFSCSCSFSSSSSFSVEEIFFLSFSFSFFIIYGCVCVACFKEIVFK